jgi:hypothetical protein
MLGLEEARPGPEEARLELAGARFEIAKWSPDSELACRIRGLQRW